MMKDKPLSYLNYLNNTKNIWHNEEEGKVERVSIAATETVSVASIVE